MEAPPEAAGRRLVRPGEGLAEMLGAQIGSRILSRADLAQRRLKESRREAPAVVIALKADMQRSGLLQIRLGWQGHQDETGP